jgi:3-oxoadipate enol-lactonase
LKAVAQPALVIVGDHDRLSLEPSRELAAALPRVRLVVVARAGHVVNLADPSAFNAAVEAMLRDLG